MGGGGAHPLVPPPPQPTSVLCTTRGTAYTAQNLHILPIDENVAVPVPSFTFANFCLSLSTPTYFFVILQPFVFILFVHLPESVRIGRISCYVVVYSC